MLSHPTASRAKAPRRRPPSAAFSVPSEDDPSLDPPPINGIPGVDKEKAPWVQELKMNQAKKSSIANSVIGMFLINNNYNYKLNFCINHQSLQFQKYLSID